MVTREVLQKAIWLVNYPVALISAPAVILDMSDAVGSVDRRPP